MAAGRMERGTVKWVMKSKLLVWADQKTIVTGVEMFQVVGSGSGCDNVGTLLRE